jgi:hypothetical protein
VSNVFVTCFYYIKVLQIQTLYWTYHQFNEGHNYGYMMKLQNIFESTLWQICQKKTPI